MTIQIRQAKSDDWEMLRTLNNEVFEDNAVYDKYLNVAWPFTEAGKKHYHEAVADPDHVTFLAFDEDKPVGHIVGGPKEISFRNVKTLEIYEIGVSPAYRSQGVGAKLIDTLKVWGKEKGYQTLMVNSYSTNEKAIAFYKKQGLQPIDINLEMDL
jgi:ribosomal protein S18 acetylase RimI-like enzyme